MLVVGVCIAPAPRQGAKRSSRCGRAGSSGMSRRRCCTGASAAASATVVVMAVTALAATPRHRSAMLTFQCGPVPVQEGLAQRWPHQIGNPDLLVVHRYHHANVPTSSRNVVPDVSSRSLRRGHAVANQLGKTPGRRGARPPPPPVPRQYFPRRP